MNERIIVEWDKEDNQWLVLFPDGAVEAHATPKDVLASITRKATQKAKASDTTVYSLTEWRKAPEGFEPPTKILVDSAIIICDNAYTLTGSKEK